MWKITATSALSVLLVSGVIAAPHKTWAITELLAHGSVIAMTNSERVIGVLQTETGRLPFVWHRGDLVYLPFYPADINDSGQVVGQGTVNGHSAAAVWEHGTITYLGMVPDYPESSPEAINNAGQVVGRAAQNVAPYTTRAVLWSPEEAIPLEGLSDSSSEALDINDNGQVVGRSFDGNNFHAVLWEGGAITRLPQPITDLESAAVAINNRGQAVGWSLGTDGVSRAILWDRGTAIELLRIAPGFAYPSAINERGQVVGFVHNTFRYLPWVWEDGVVTPLPFPVGPPPFGGLRAVDINNRGDIIGTSGSDESLASFFWTR